MGTEFTGQFEALAAEGLRAHADEAKRTDNPYLTKAIMWDKGWVAGAREEYAKTGAATRIVGFKDWICLQ